jgi:signal transduction histidine kinase
MQRTFLIVVVVAGLSLVALLARLLFVTLKARNQARDNEAAMAVINRELESALAAKSEFLASTSHEMRTPLNGIIGMAQILLTEEQLPDKARGQIELINNAGSAMRALVDDLLDVAKIEHGGFTISPRATRLAPILEDVVGQSEANARIAGLSLDLSIDAPDIDLLLDPDRVRQILVNLVGNAIKFTEEGGVAVSARKIDRPDRHSIQIMVRDTGPGIAPEWHEQIFELFKQVDGSRTRRHGGTGLGLAISRQLARAMGGDIMLDSSPGNGSIFTIELPYQPAAVTTAKSTLHQPLAAIWVLAADPLRAALLTNMAQRSGAAVDALPPAKLAVELDRAESEAGQTLIIDSRALALLPGDGQWLPLVTERQVIIVGDATDSPDHALRKLGKSAAFALNSLLPMLQRQLADHDDVTISRLQFAADAPTLTEVAPTTQYRIAGVSDRGG